MENISDIKTGFIDYLKDKYGEEAAEKIDSYSPELSIFMYSTDFQKYLVSNGYADVSVFSQSISEIKEMLASGGTENTQDTAANENGENTSDTIGDNFMLTALTDVINQDQDLYAAINTNANETIDQEEIMAFLNSVDAAMQANPDGYDSIFDGIAKEIQNIKGADKETSVEDLLESIYSSDAALEYLDLDGDGEISNEEKELFEKYVQGDKEELTSEDLQKALEEIENGEYIYNAKLPETEKDKEDVENEEQDNTSASNNGVSGGSGGSPIGFAGSGGISSGGGSVGSSTTQQKETTPSDVNDMNLEQLKEEQTTRQGNVDTAKENVDTILSDIDEMENGDYADARQAYDEAVENDDNIDQELKDQRTENLNAIETTNGEIDSLNSQIAQAEVDLGAANDKLDGDKKTLEALQNAFDSYDEASTDNSQEQGEIAQIKQDLQNQIDELENTTIPEDEEECERLEQLLNGGGDSEGLKEQLENKETELETLEGERETIENKILEIYENDPENPTRLALEAFQDAEEKLSELRDQLPEAQEKLAQAQADLAQEKLAQAQADLTEVNELIRTKEAEQTEQENSYYSGSLPAELVSQLDAKLGDGFCAKLEEVAKNINCDPKDLLGMMQSESGINPQAQNPNGGATGLIQFMPSTAEGLGTSTSALMNMSAIEQLDYVEKYFLVNSGNSGQRLTGGDLYALCFLPGYFNNEVLCSSTGSTAVYYNENSLLDANGDGNITKTELGERVANKYQEVLSMYGLA